MFRSLILSLFLFVTLSSPLSAKDWTLRVLDNFSGGGQCAVSATDGTIHILAVNGAGNGIRHFTLSGEDVLSKDIPLGEDGVSPKNLSLSFGGDGNLHALFHNAHNPQKTRVHYLRGTPSGVWTASVVGSRTTPDLSQVGSVFTSITSSRNNPDTRYLFFDFGTTPSSKEMRVLLSGNSSTDWMDQTTDFSSKDTAAYGGRILYGTDGLRRFFLLAGSGLDRILRYYHPLDNGFGPRELIDADCDRIHHPWFVLGREGKPTVVYGDGRRKTLKIAFRQSFKNWSIEDIEPSGGGGFYPSLSFSKEGAPHCVYFTKEGETAKLVHAVKTEGVWNKETIADAGTLAGQFRPEIFLSDKIIRVIFFSNSTAALMVAEKDISPEIAKNEIGCSLRSHSFSFLWLLAPLLFLAPGK